MKEHLRAEVRKELEKIELRYRDMASLLRGLGIRVGGGPYPMPREVKLNTVEPLSEECIFLLLDSLELTV